MNNDTTPVLIWVDKVAKNDISQKFETIKNELQKVLDAYNSIRSTNPENGKEPTSLPILETQEFVDLFEAKETLLFDKLTKGNGIIVSGVALNKTKALEIIEKPEGWEPLVKMLEALNTIPKDGHALSHVRSYFTSSTITKYFIVSEDGQTIGYSEAYNSYLEGVGKHYAKSPKAIAMHEFTKEAIHIFREKGLDKSFGIKGEDAMIDVIRNTIHKINWSDGTFVPRTGYLSNIS